MGRVYRALDRLRGTEVALKQLLVAPSHRAVDDTGSEHSPPRHHICEIPLLGGGTLRLGSDSDDWEQKASAEGLSALAEEFRTLTTLRHPNVISVLDYGFDAAGQPFYTMELLVQAEPLLQFAHGRPLKQQLELVIQVLHALTYLHRRGIVHRDLTPSNVLVVSGPEGPLVKVLDFGLAIDAERGNTTSAAGTLLYMAPEIFHGEPASVASDLYAIGAMTYQLLAGRHPFLTEGGTANQLRQVLGEEADLTVIVPAVRSVIGRTLSKDPAQRPANAATLLREIAEAAGIPITNEPVSTRDSYLLAARFVGRHQELGQLCHSLDSAQQGEGSAWLLCGESGVGKSRLLEELRSAALISGVLTVRGQAVPDGAAYHLWQEVLKNLALQIPLSDLAASVLATVVPELPQLLERELPPPSELDAPGTRLRILRVVDDALERLPVTMLLLLEDLQWADGASLALLAHMTQSHSARALMVVASCRTEEAPALPASLPHMKRLALPRLTRSEMEQLCSSMLGPAGKEQSLVDLIASETEGNTYFIVEVVRALAAEAGSLATVGQRGLPERVFAGGMEQVLKRRLSLVPAQARTLLQLAAVAGRQIDLPLLTYLIPQAEEQIRELADLGILEFHIPHWRFCHDKLRDRMCESIGEDEGRALHGRIAQGLQAVYPGVAGRPAQIALHHRQAGQIEAAAHYYRLAGNEALHRGVPGEAAAMFEQASRLHQRMEVSRIEQIRVVRGLTEARFGLGQHREAESSLRQLCSLAGTPLPTHGLELWSMVGWLSAALLAHRMGLSHRSPPMDSEERTIQSELLTVLGLEEIFVWTDQAELGLLCALWELHLEDRLALEPRRTYHSSGLFFILSCTPLRGLCRRYLMRYEGRAASNSHTAINYCRVRALVEINNSNFQVASHYAVQAVRLSREYKDDLALLHSLLQLQLAAAGLDDFPQMLSVGREMASLAARAENPRYMALAYICQGAAQLSMGELVDATERLEQAHSCLPHELGSIPEALTLGLLATCARHRLQLERAESLADQALLAVQKTRWTLAQLRHPLFCILDVYLGRERAEYPIANIEIALARLHQLARMFDHVGSSYELVHGLYHWRLGQPRRALRSFQRSIELADKFKAGIEKAQAQYWLGRFVQSPAGKGLTSEGAAPYLRAALATFERLHCAKEASNAREALAMERRAITLDSK